MSEISYSEFVAENLSSASKLFSLAECDNERVLSYLTAAMKVASEKNERILITVANKNLQKQIWEKDIPNILPSLSDKVRPAILKERFNYLCLRKFYNAIENADIYLTTEERINFFALITWQSKTKDGDLSEALHFNRAPILWKKVACEAGSCLGAQCEHFSKCYFQNAKKTAENSNILLVSHKLFLQDLQMDFAILPPYSRAIFDNAHKLPFESQKVFGRHLYFYALRNAVKQNSWCKKWEEQAAECEKLFLNLIKEIQNYSQKVKKRRIIYNNGLSSETGVSPEPLQNALKTLLGIIEQTSSEFHAQNDLGKTKDCMQFASDIRKISCDIAFLFAASHSDLVYWVECLSNPYQVAFNAEPVNVSAKWSKSLYPILKSALWTSDTITVNGQFEYLINRLGLFGKNPKTKVFSEQGVASAVSIFAADFLPKPTDESFNAELLKALCEILEKNNSNTLIFSDFGAIQKLQEKAKEQEQGKTCFFQGADGTFYNLAGFFQKEAGSVLVGTHDELKSLEDMDLPENSLIVISRLPFPDMKEPVLARRAGILKEQNKNGFALLTMPEVTLTLRRVYSALLRSGKKQSLLFLDSRIATEQYGAKIQKLFPDLKILSHRVFSTGFF
ncbi:MAG: ATP-dependent DNA helicase [Fibromonadaceae bacterium]|jgi:Rad3-related DNA helicase|nr:ATP-dependent DNA helicase [Fibromonadaceae bacterium]